MVPLWWPRCRFLAVHTLVNRLHFCPMLEGGRLWALDRSNCRRSSQNQRQIVSKNPLLGRCDFASKGPTVFVSELGALGTEGRTWVLKRFQQAIQMFVRLAQRWGFLLPQSAGSEYYCWISENCQENFECSCVLKVPTPPVFAYLSDVVLQHDHSASEIWHIGITEYVVIALLRILAAVRDGMVGVVCIDPQVGRNGCDVLFPLPSDVLRRLDDISLFEILCGSGFDPVVSLLANCRSSNIDWAGVDPAQLWYP